MGKVPVVRQVWTIATIELRRAFFSRRAFWVYALALFPTAIFLGHAAHVKIRHASLSASPPARPGLIDSVRDLETDDAVLERLGHPASDRQWNNPHRKIIGKRKKLEKVWASKTSLTATAMNRPRKVDATDIRRTVGTTSSQSTRARSTRNAAMSMGTKALIAPNRMAPPVLASISSSSGTGASSSRSKERFFFSKVTVTASREVVPNRMDRATTPGSIEATLSSPLPDLMKNMPVQASGKMKPQLKFGGFR